MGRILRCSGLAMLGILTACGGQTAAPQAAGPAADLPPTVAPESAPAALKDVVEHDATRTVGISFPPGIDRTPGLARLLGDSAAAGRARPPARTRRPGHQPPDDEKQCVS